MMLAPEVETRPWEEQLALDEAPYREQLAYLLERSAFYREKLARPADVGGLADIARLPLTEKARAARHGHAGATRSARTCARRRAEIVRIYSTSGTTGTPSYIPLTASDLEQLGDGLGAQLRGLGHRAPGSGSSPPTTPGRSSRARRWRRSSASGWSTSRSAPATPSG